MTYYAIAVPLFVYDFYGETPAPVFPLSLSALCG